MPIISVSVLAGRSAEKRQQLLRALTDAAVASFDVPVSAVRVILTEVAPEHWAVGGITKTPLPSEEEQDID